MATNDDGFVPYWLEEPDWLVTIVMLSGNEVVEDDLQDLNWVGRLFAFTQATDTRILALIGDPDGPTYELLFSFNSEENKRRFLELVKQDGYADPLEENTFTVPDESEIRDARPIGLVFPESQADYITQVAVMTAMGLQMDSEGSGA